jgi:DNA gyrase subunit A
LRITAVRDESNRDGVRFIIEVRRDASANVILNNLYKLTSVQTNFSFNMLAIVDGAPKILSVKEILTHYIVHQKVVTRRTQFDKEKAEARAHILEGLLIALIILMRSSTLSVGQKLMLLLKLN